MEAGRRGFQGFSEWVIACAHISSLVQNSKFQAYRLQSEKLNVLFQTIAAYQGLALMIPGMLTTSSWL